jgi:hypothetical protein
MQSIRRVSLTVKVNVDAADGCGVEPLRDFGQFRFVGLADCAFYCG